MHDTEISERSEKGKILHMHARHRKKRYIITNYDKEITFIICRY